MIDFACKKFSLEEIMKCSLNLSKAELEVLKVLLSKKEFITSNDIKKVTGLDLTTVQRGLKKTYTLGFTERQQRNITSGGYEFLYRIKSKEVVRRKVIDIVDKWAKKVESEFNRW